MKYFLLIIILFTGLSKGNAQAESQKINLEDFPFIEKHTDIYLFKFIQTIKCNSKPGDDIPSLYRAIRNEAAKNGANCFKYVDFKRDSTGKMSLTLDVYYAVDSVLKINYLNHEKNTVYIFSNDKINNRLFSFSINDEKLDLCSGEFYKYLIPEGKEVRVNKGGITGTTCFISWGKNRSSEYLSITGFGLDLTHRDRNGITFTSGKIQSIEPSLGRLLSVVLTKMKE